MRRNVALARRVAALFMGRRLRAEKGIPSFRTRAELFDAILRQNWRLASTLLHDHPMLGRCHLVDGMTGLHVAATAGSVRFVATLIEHGADVNAVTPSGSTPLHLAAEQWAPTVIRYLLLSGANPDVRDGVGRSALDIAIAQNDHLSMSVLLRAHELVGSPPPE